MKNKVRSQAYLRKRKVMMVLPLLVVPFLTMAFWALGGGRSESSEQIQTQGLNLRLPTPKISYDFTDKLSFYDQADKDSIKLAEQMRNDPYYRHQDSMKNVYLSQLEQFTQSPAENLKISPYDKASSPAEAKIIKKLAELNSVINQPE